MSDRTRRLQVLVDYLRQLQPAPMSIETSSGFTVAILVGHEKDWDKAIVKGITLHSAIAEACEELQVLVDILEAAGENI